MSASGSSSSSAARSEDDGEVCTARAAWEATTTMCLRAVDARLWTTATIEREAYFDRCAIEGIVLYNRAKLHVFQPELRVVIGAVYSDVCREFRNIDDAWVRRSRVLDTLVEKHAAAFETVILHLAPFDLILRRSKASKVEKEGGSSTSVATVKTTPAITRKLLIDVLIAMMNLRRKVVRKLKKKRKRTRKRSRLADLLHECGIRVDNQ